MRRTVAKYSDWFLLIHREVHLVWRNRYFRGWTASVRSLGEGARETAAAPVAPAFGGLMAARIPAGHSEVTFRFAPPGFFPLFLWTYLSLFGFAIFTAWIALRRRSAATPSTGSRVRPGT